jgi:hypothetical protein
MSPDEANSTVLEAHYPLNLGGCCVEEEEEEEWYSAFH